MKPTQNYPLLLNESGMQSLKSPRISTEAESPFLTFTPDINPDGNSDRIGLANKESWRALERASDSIKVLKDLIFERLLSEQVDSISRSSDLSEIDVSFRIGLEGESGVPFLAKGKDDAELEIQLKWTKV